MTIYKSSGKRIGVSRKYFENVAIQQVEKTADEPILSAMVKTAIHENVAAANEAQSAPVTLMDVEQGAWKEPNAQQDGFRYDYDDNI